MKREETKRTEAEESVKDGEQNGSVYERKNTYKLNK